MRLISLFKKIIARWLIILCPVTALAQSGEVRTKRVVTDRILVRGARVDTVRTDTAGWQNANYSVPTAAAVYKMIMQNPFSKGDSGEPGPQGIQGPQGVQGVQGITGATGAQGVQGITGATGPQGVQGVQGLQGVKGDKGEDGTSVTIKGSFSNAGSLPGSGVAGDSYMVGDSLYVWSVTLSAWQNVGRIRGTQGVQGVQGVQGFQGAAGAQGVQGIQGLPGIQGAAGPQGLQGIKGDKGDKGDDGTGVTIKGSVSNVGSLPGSGVAGDSYMVGDSLYVWSVSSSTWQNVGRIRGPQGIQGTQGVQGPQGIQGIVGPQGIQGVQGLTGAQGAQGPQGLQGLKGDKGDDGKGVTIKGTYASVGSLPGSGSIGDSYMVGDSLYVWDAIGDAWHNVGRIVGPQGIAGPQGVQGIQGATGPQGLTGAQGAMGVKGDKGDKGDAGSQGVQGIQGVKGDAGNAGANGADGADGNNWLTGTATPTGALGDTSDLYLQTTTGDVYKKNASSVWEPIGNLKGPAGSGAGATPGIYSTNATAGQTAFAVPYALPINADGINFYRNGIRLTFTKSSNTLTIIYDCDANDKIVITWLE